MRSENEWWSLEFLDHKIFNSDIPIIKKKNYKVNKPMPSIIRSYNNYWVSQSQCIRGFQTN